MNNKIVRYFFDGVIGVNGVARIPPCSPVTPKRHSVWCKWCKAGFNQLSRIQVLHQLHQNTPNTETPETLINKGLHHLHHLHQGVINKLFADKGWSMRSDYFNHLFGLPESTEPTCKPCQLVADTSARTSDLTRSISRTKENFSKTRIKAKVWRVTLDGKPITIIDHEGKPDDEFKAGVESRFGAERVTHFEQKSSN